MTPFKAAGERRVEAGPRTAGFTVIEIMVALVVLSTLAFSLATSMVAVQRVNSGTRERDVAREAAHSRLQVISALDYAQLGQRDGDVFVVDELTGQSANPGNPGSVTVMEVRTGLTRVTVRVDWDGVLGEQSFELSTELADPQAN